jgi:alpha-ketoglutarate-dependent taurine dioxygenase
MIAGGGLFVPGDPEGYARWREAKLAAWPAGAAGLRVEIAGLGALSEDERAAIRGLCRRTNLAIYACRDRTEPERAAIGAFAAGLGLVSIDRHLCADASGITALTVPGDGSDGGQSRYIPYSDRALSWHTDGYYNADDRPIRAVILHCVRDAAEGGENALLDHEIAYIHLRDENPGYIEALMHPEAMTIPANHDGVRQIRPARRGPVFSIDGSTGTLHMRFSARKRNIEWRDDAATRAAVAFLGELLADPGGPAVHCRLSPGQGIIGNNVLHNRTAFRDDTRDDMAARRLVYRLRSHDRVAGTGRGEAA